ncbi:MAG TPA: hypothetical protein VE133_13705, partial [Candidatus Sulfotelmatobacter sp.]|nr:hypothetical protein [Candidatus Sulfotelmatobacter sp.]
LIMQKIVPFAAILLLSFSVVQQAAAQGKHSSGPMEYLALIERAAEHETQALESPQPFQFTERLNWNWGSETRSVIETPEGRADRIVLYSDEPLQLEQQQRQIHRLQKLLRDHDAVKDELQDQKSEKQRRIRMIKALPKALTFKFAGRERGLLRFSFSPNPEFSPKDRETQMYRGMEGTLWLEPTQERLVRIEGRLVKDVSFGWGILGRLNKGGIYEIGQTQVAPGVWRITTLNVDVKGRVFLLNSFKLFREESNSHFRPASNSITYREAVQALLLMPVPLLQKTHP